MNHSTYHRKALFVGHRGRQRPAARLRGPCAQDQDITNLGIEEMVVTAQKREENVQAVPISISTLSATDIERRGVQNARDLIVTLPEHGRFRAPGRARATCRSRCAASAPAARATSRSTPRPACTSTGS